MAIVNLQGGDREVIIKQITQDNFDDIVAQDAADTNAIDESLLDNVGGAGLNEFRTIVNANVAVIDTALGSSVGSSYSLQGGESWDTCRSKLNSIFTALDALLPIS